MGRARTRAQRYGIALAALGLGVTARLALAPRMGDRAPLAPSFLAMAAVATTVGFGPAMLVLVGGGALLPVLSGTARRPLGWPTSEEVQYLLIYGISGVAVAAMCAALREARRKADASRAFLAAEIERREQAESQLRDRERLWLEERARFRAFMDHSPALAYIKDDVGRYVWGNRAWAAQFDRPATELIGLDDFALWPEATAREFRVSDQAALDSDQVAEAFEAVGDRHFMSLKFPIENDGVRMVGGKTLDVTETVRAGEAVRRSEGMLTALADSMPQIVWAAPPDGRTDYYNRRWFEFTGLTEEQSYQSGGWTLVLHPEDMDRAERAWARAVESGEPYEIEYRFVDRARGGYRWQLARGLPVRDDAGAIVRWYGTCTDIDDQKRAEAAADGANQAKDRFLAVLSHELRTPLTPILLAVSSLLDDPSADLGATRSALELIRRNVALESRLIDDLLDVMRIVRGKFSLEVEPCDAHVIIERALEICRGDLEASGATVALHLDATDPTIVADPSRLQQVFWNLVKNAAKFSPGGGPITIRTRDEPSSGRLVVEVADAGVGIEPEFLPRVFDAFEQGEASPWTRKFGGLGLGLAISRAIVSAHAGEITAQSEGPDRGATFRVELPTVSAPIGTLRAKSPEMPDTRRSPTLRIFLIEDDPSTLSVLSRLLRLDGHAISTANCVKAAREVIDRDGCEFDLIISDIGLPDGNGLELMRDLQSRRPCPAIALTGFGMEDDVRRGLDVGFRAHLTKPIDFRTLEATIREVLASGA